MGLFGIGGGGGKLARHEKKLTNAYIQTAERKRIMAVLADMQSEDALSVLLKRFTYRTEGSIVDEEEKELAYHYLMEAGPRAIGPIERFVAENDGVYWPLKALRSLAGDEHAVELLLGALDRASLLDNRVNEQKAQLVSNLRDFPHPKVRDRLVELTKDEDDDVRIMALDGLMTYGKDDALGIIVERILDPEESLRTKSVLYEQLVDLEWPLTDWVEQLEEAAVLPQHYRVGGGDKLVRT